MTLQKIETFEHDIADEVLKKEASVTKVAAADALVNDVSKELGKQAPPHASPFFVSFLIVVVVIIILGGGGYYAYTSFFSPQPKQTAKTQQTPPPASNKPKAEESLFTRSFPTLTEPLGQYVRKAEKNQTGFTLLITEYSPVLAYIIKNENTFSEAISNALLVAPENRSGPYVFSDVTLSNTNMRVGVSGSSTVVYAFIGTKAVLISTSTDGIIQSSGAILK